MTALPYSYKAPLLTLDHVSMQYGPDLILRDLNAQVLDVIRPGLSQGQVVGIYGRSGIGKSVLCRLLAGLAAPTAGTVLVGEAQEPVQAGMVGYVQQRYPLFGHYTLQGNLLLAARRRHDPAEAKARVEHYLGRFGLAAHAGKYPAHLSGGQRQRAAIAQQLLCSEHLILLDEPFSGLDVAMIDEVKRLIVEVTTLDELNTVLIVSHDIATTTALADRLWLLAPERSPDTGQLLPGATLSSRHQYNLAQLGLAWHPDVESEPEFVEFVEGIKQEIRGS